MNVLQVDHSLYLVVKHIQVMLNIIVVIIVVKMPLTMETLLSKFIKIRNIVYQHVQVNIYMIELKYILNI